MSSFTELVDLAAERLGGAVLWATDDFFASKDNLLKPAEAVFIEGKYTDRGKWMDGWESRRKRAYAESSRRYPDEDFAIVRLGLPGVLRGVVVDTSHFKGNYPSAFALEGASLDGNPDLTTILSDQITWTEVIPRTNLRGDSKNEIPVSGAAQRFTHLRFRIFPDGGVARLRVHGEVVPSARWLGRRERPELVDLAAAANGGLVVACNDMFFGSRHNLVMPGRGVNMGDGWETKRARRAGPDWVVVRLATEGAIERAIVDTLHFKGNAPDFCAIDVATVADGDPDGADDAAFRPLLDKTRLEPHTEHVFDLERGLAAAGDVTHARLRIWPDGGVSRLRLFGFASARGREASGMKYVRAMPDPELDAGLSSCCGSRAFVDGMKRERPLSSLDAMKSRAAAIWRALAPADWEEALRAHPRIGDKKAAPAQSATAAAWSSGEQAKVASASASTLDELRAINAAYEAKFGRVYVVCATGKTADEMLAIAKERMAGDADAELRRAADEQRKITELRLEKWVLR